MVDTFSITMEVELKNKLNEVVKSGRHGRSRSAVVSYYISRGIELEEYAEQGIDLMRNFLDALEKDPGLASKFRKFLEDQ
jgi:metal-responsive CopG/Arc/MetJ family transcriptional regulator